MPAPSRQSRLATLQWKIGRRLKGLPPERTFEESARAAVALLRASEVDPLLRFDEEWHSERPSER